VRRQRVRFRLAADVHAIGATEIQFGDDERRRMATEKLFRDLSRSRCRDAVRAAQHRGCRHGLWRWIDEKKVSDG
jgi:hypothetical protein